MSRIEDARDLEDLADDPSSRIVYDLDGTLLEADGHPDLAEEPPIPDEIAKAEDAA